MPSDTIQSRDISSIIKAEAADYQSRGKVTILAGQDLAIGTVLGKVTAGSVPTTGTLTAVGSENGTCTSVTGGKNVRVGSYTIKCIQAVANAGVFEVKNPLSQHIGTVAIAATGAGATGVFTSDEINFTLTDGSSDFVYNSLFTITVPAGGAQFREIDLDGVDGSQIAAGILGPYAVDASASGEETLAYTSGGTYEIQPGDTITGGTSGATARVVAITLTSGTYAGGDAAGTMTLDTVSGTFQSETLNIGANSNVATIAGDSTAVAAADIDGTAFLRDCQYIDDYLVWPTGATAAQKATAKAELELLGIIERGMA